MIINVEDIDHFEYDGFRLPRHGEWYSEGMQGYYSTIYLSHIDFTHTPYHIYRPIRKIVIPTSNIPLTDKFQDEGW